MYKWLKFSRKILLSALQNHPHVTVSLPTETEVDNYVESIGRLKEEAVVCDVGTTQNHNTPKTAKFDNLACDSYVEVDVNIIIEIDGNVDTDVDIYVDADVEVDVDAEWQF